MILSPYEGKLLVVMQPDHGIQTGLFASAWGNDDVPGIDSHVEAIHLAATHHDDGWAGWERRPTIDPEVGRPTQFLALTPLEHVPLYRYGIERAAQHNPWTGLLVSMHGAGLYNARYGTFQLAEQHFNEKEKALVDEFLADMAAMQTALAGSTASAHTHISYDPLVRYEYLLLQVWDRLSLQYTYRLAADGVISPLPRMDGTVDELSCRHLGNNHLSLDPYPFVEDNMVFPVISSLIADRPYRTPEEFLEAVADAKPRHLECHASRH